MNWYYELNGQRQGPVPESALQGLLASGTITQRTLVWREGMANWAPLAEAWTPPPAATGAETPGSATPEPGWVQCTATGRWFPPAEIVTIGGKPYSVGAKAQVLQGALESGVLPSGGESERTGPAWEQRAELGFIKAAWETIKNVLTNPAETFTRMKREGGAGTPLSFIVLWGSIGSWFGLAFQFLPYFLGVPGFDGGEMDVFKSLGVTAVPIVIFLLAMPIFMLISAYVGAGILHLSLMVCGGAKQGFETTLRTYCYAHGSTSMLQVVPFCGGYVAGLWAIIATCIGLSKTHEITTGRAVCAVLLPTAVCCIGVMFVVGAAVAAFAATQSAH